MLKLSNYLKEIHKLFVVNLFGYFYSGMPRNIKTTEIFTPKLQP